MTQLVYIRNFKKQYRFSIVLHLESFPKCINLHVTDKSHMKDILQLTTAIVMASSAKKKNKPKSLKH